jgi:glycosyltransferase involved in cell wall biosynthesis
VRLLLGQRPRVVFASNPSLILTYFLLAARLILRFRFVSDAHYTGVVSVSGSHFVQRLLDFVNRRADLVVVTNQAHARHVQSIGGTAFVCPDPLPRLAAAPTKPAPLAQTQRAVLYVCSYDHDEPWAQVFAAAHALAQQGFSVFASGPYERAGLTPGAVPHVTLLGYVDRPTYEAFLRNVDVVLVLTTWPDCLVCGAYEAMAAGKPCVLSRSTTLTGFFTHGTIFTSHDPRDIASAVVEAYGRRDQLGAQIPAWVVAHEAALHERAGALRAAADLPAP